MIIIGMILSVFGYDVKSMQNYDMGRNDMTIVQDPMSSVIMMSKDFHREHVPRHEGYTLNCMDHGGDYDISYVHDMNNCSAKACHLLVDSGPFVAACPPSFAPNCSVILNAR